MKQSRIENILLCLNSGQVDAGWVAFLDLYSDLLRGIVRQYETQGGLADDCYEYVCAKLSDDDFRRLKAFDPHGPARFRTWLTAVTANLCKDWRRSLYGRQRPYRVIRDLPDVEQLVFLCLYRQGMTHHECLNVLKGQNPNLEAADISRINSKLQQMLSGTQRWQTSVRRNESIAADDPDLSLSAPTLQPEERIQFDQDCEHLEKALSKLEPEQRLLLQLRYQQDLTLKEVARLTGLEDPFKARRAIDKALAALEKIFNL